VESDAFMVVSSHHLASDAGAEILRAGGNAIDAAVAVAYAEAVVNPCCGNIGGGGFLVAHLASGRDIFLDFRETAPAAATPGMFLDAAGSVIPESSVFGWRAIAVPGTVLGLDTALTRYGHLSRAQVMAPAIRLAHDGFVLDRADTDILDFRAARFKTQPAVAKVFLHDDGSRFRAGERLVQSDLAGTLSDIAAQGPDAFYRGRIPQAVETAAKAGGGIITAADFAAYTVPEAAPLSCSYRGRQIMSAPPPSSGGATLCEILNILDGYDLRAMGFHSAAEVHVLAEAMRHAYLDRNTGLGDPAFVNNPLDRLLSKDYAAAIRQSITDRATPSAELRPGTAPHEQTETTHVSVIDRDGNAVALTYTINGAFGAVAMAPGTGILLNDEMDDFSIKPDTANLYGLVQGAANAIAPGKRPLSSMAPTIVTRDGNVALVLGSPGGARIITITLETLVNFIDHKMTPQEAVDAPRVHLQYLPDTLYAEPFALSPDTAALLHAMGYSITPQTPWGAVELIAAGLEKSKRTAPSSGGDSARSGGMLPGWFYGSNDPRRPAGSAVGR
jgi:gamma-glutamyltranspeptidase / glutathione hydrolase